MDLCDKFGRLLIFIVFEGNCSQTFNDEAKKIEQIDVIHSEYGVASLGGVG